MSLDDVGVWNYSYRVMETNFLQRSAKKVLAGTMIFWLSGLLFLFCCEMPTHAQAAETDSCPLAKINHCDKKTAGKNSLPSASLQAETNAFACCILPNIFDKARKIENVQPIADAAAPAITISKPKFLLAKIEFEFPATYQSPVLSRNETYLKNRVFRI
jgi:hypothetical protein